MGQLAGYWVMEQDFNTLAMPISFERIEFFGPEPCVGSQHNYSCDVRLRSLDDSACRSDIELKDENGAALITITGWQTRRFQMDKAFMLNTMQVERRLVCESFDEGFVLFRDQYDAAVTRDYAARCLLNQEETAV